MARVWYRQWLYLAHESEIPEAGDYVIRRLLGESVIVIRTAPGEVAAMLNVCRHRGARIVGCAVRAAQALRLPVPPVDLRPGGRAQGSAVDAEQRGRRLRVAGHDPAAGGDLAGAGLRLPRRHRARAAGRRDRPRSRPTWPTTGRPACAGSSSAPTRATPTGR